MFPAKRSKDRSDHRAFSVATVGVKHKARVSESKHSIEIPSPTLDPCWEANAGTVLDTSSRPEENPPNR